MILYCYNLFYNVTVESLVLGPLIKFIIALHSCIGRDSVFRYSTEFWKCYLCGQGRLLPQTDYDQVTGLAMGLHMQLRSIKLTYLSHLREATDIGIEGKKNQVALTRRPLIMTVIT